ncbi:MAG: GNAT family acetyltransferase [Verrucomicrobia bacterium]|nr:GNAT family acetyltransferase [Verrucomicrobiota bacterium]
MSLKIRPYSLSDRQAVRDICCDTGFMGNPIDPVYQDRDAFADFFTRYYTDREPENALVAVDDDRVVGYLLGCLNFDRFNRQQLWLILSRTTPKIIGRILTGKYNWASIKFLNWFLFKSAGQTPKGIPGAAHFHINMYSEYRTGFAGRRLIFPFVNRLAKLGFKGVYGQMQVYEDRRSEKALERYGFKFMDRRQVTKFKDFHDKPVWVATVYNEFKTDKTPLPKMQ